MSVQLEIIINKSMTISRNTSQLVVEYIKAYVCLEFEFMFKERQKQKTSPTHQETEVLQEKHETRSVGLHSTHLWKLMEERK